MAPAERGVKKIKIMNTTTIEIILLVSLIEYIEKLVKDGHYSNASDYICALIRADQKRRTIDKKMGA